MDDRSTDDMPIIALQQDRDILPGRKGCLQVNRLAGPCAENRHRTDDIRLLECPTAVFAASDRGLMQAIVADQQQCPGAATGTNRDSQSRRPSLDTDRRGGFLAQRRLSQRVVHGCRV